MFATASEATRNEQIMAARSARPAHRASRIARATGVATPLLLLCVAV
jgi:hypothetical protein